MHKWAAISMRCDELFDSFACRSRGPAVQSVMEAQYSAAQKAQWMHCNAIICTQQIMCVRWRPTQPPHLASSLLRSPAASLSSSSLS